MTKIDYFYSLLSPFTYLAGMKLEEIAARHGADIVYRPTDLFKVFNETGGLPVPKRHPFRQEYRLQELNRLPKMAGLPLNIQPKHWPVDATAASVAVISIVQAGGDGGAISHAFLRACWAEDRDISDRETIAAILSENGFDLAEVERGSEAASEEFAANTQRALDNGVFGAPFYVVDGERFWGQDRLAHLDWHLGQIGS